MKKVKDYGGVCVCVCVIRFALTLGVRRQHQPGEKQEMQWPKSELHGLTAVRGCDGLTVNTHNRGWKPAETQRAEVSGAHGSISVYASPQAVSL